IRQYAKNIEDLREMSKHAINSIEIKKYEITFDLQCYVIIQSNYKLLHNNSTCLYLKIKTSLIILNYMFPKHDVCIETQVALKSLITFVIDKSKGNIYKYIMDEMNSASCTDIEKSRKKELEGQVFETYISLQEIIIHI
ncbi:hypothetical protein RFI_34261, partial [Reticulomyxa filosa]